MDAHLHEFHAGDCLHHDSQEIYEVLNFGNEEMNVEAGIAAKQVDVTAMAARHHDQNVRPKNCSLRKERNNGVFREKTDQDSTDHNQPLTDHLLSLIKQCKSTKALQQIHTHLLINSIQFQTQLPSCQTN
ncbi:hypothetical protein RJ639_025888 [Escallonia herrerae]|uniref:Uncharacterized protein n=1 Tax=Escallonia herrerae TaxID=1293975 RepID=A0AA88UX92_9ASTE|nr:hypothetical protein RJ639_025888 [Escallonia herrerae]